MKKYVWIIGILLLLLHVNNMMPLQVQAILFVIGVLLVGVPHGAADLLVGMQNAKQENRIQTRFSFLSAYLLKLFLFGSLFYLFPIVATILFLLMAAFHFGETDLNRFNTDSFTGKLFALSYGLLIIGFILLFHLEEAAPFLTELTGNKFSTENILLIADRKEFLIYSLLIFFFTSTFIHFLRKPNDAINQELFLWRLVALFILLYNLPLLLGFFFYFVVWHSLESLYNIVGYLQNNGRESMKTITKTILAYSAFTFAGIAVLFFLFRAVLSQQALIMGAFAALAVLTAPHLMVMHDMYANLRRKIKPGVN